MSIRTFFHLDIPLTYKHFDPLPSEMNFLNVYRSVDVMISTGWRIGLVLN